METPSETCELTPALTILSERLAIAKLSPEASIPAWAEGKGFCSITRTDDELSIVVPQERVPADVLCERDFRCLKVEGPLDFDLTGVLVRLVAPLAEARISTFALSTYDTDYILFRQSDLDRARNVLTAAGHEVT